MNRLLITLLIVSLSPALAAADELEESVRHYWDAMNSRDKASALQYVHPEDLNNFLYRSDGLLNSWRLERIDRVSESQAAVVVTVNRQFKHGLVKDVTVKSSWERTEQGWKLRVPSTREAVLKALGGPDPEEAKMPASLEIHPKTLRFYAISPKQPGVIFVRNGLEIPVQVVGLEFDTDRFKLNSTVEEVAALSTESITLSFIGEEKEENLQSQATLTLRQGEETRKYEIPIIYNFMNDVMRWAVRQKGRKPPQ